MEPGDQREPGVRLLELVNANQGPETTIWHEFDLNAETDLALYAENVAFPEEDWEAWSRVAERVQILTGLRL